MESIEPATFTDIPQLAELLGDLFAQEADFRPDRRKQERGLRLIIEAPHLGVVFAARHGADVVGTVSLLFTVSTAEGGPACWLEDMVVRKDRRGRGLGSRLLQHAVDHASTNGFSRINVLTDRVNAEAIRFYARHGFGHSAMQLLRMRIESFDR